MSMTKQGSSPKSVVSIKLLGRAPKLQDVIAVEDKLLPGDIVVQVSVGDVTLTAPFAGGKTGLQLELKRLYHVGETQALVNVKRLGNTHVSLHASIVQQDAGMLKKIYALRAANDANHSVTFVDSSEAECLSIQERRLACLASQLATTQLRNGFVSYPWGKKMKEQEALPEQANSVFSLLVVPAAVERPSGPHSDLEDTMSQAMTWLTAAQASGVPIGFLNIQTEPLLTKVSGQASTSSVGTDSMEMNAISKGFYGYEDYHGIDLGVLRAVRLWYFPAVSEVPIVLNLQKGETKLGLGINRMDEGFCYISSVEDDSIAARSGLKMILLAAQMAGKHVVISRIGNEKVTPTMISSSGSIHCYDTASISQKLSLHRLSGQPVTLHVLVGGGAVEQLASIAAAAGAETEATFSSCSSTSISRSLNGSSIEDLQLISSSNRSVMLKPVSQIGSGRSFSAPTASAGLLSSLSAGSNIPFRR